MSVIASGIGGLFSIGSTLFGADAARKAQAKAIEQQNQAAFGASQEMDTFLVLLAGGGAILIITFLAIRILRSAEEG